MPPPNGQRGVESGEIESNGVEFVGGARRVCASTRPPTSSILEDPERPGYVHHVVFDGEPRAFDATRVAVKEDDFKRRGEPRPLANSAAATSTSERTVRYGAGVGLYRKALAAISNRPGRVPASCEYAVTPAIPPASRSSTVRGRDPALN